VTSEYYGLKKK